MNRTVLVIGLLPELVDFSKFPGMTAAKVHAGIEGDIAKLKALGYDAHHVFVDLGETAGAVVAAKLAERDHACVCIGAGIRNGVPYFALFESLVNVVHERASGAKICFNTQPSDTAEAVQRWLPLSAAR